MIIGSAIVVIVLICTAVSGYVGWNLTHPLRKAVDSSPADYGLTYTEVQFPSRVDSVALRGWFLPAAGQGNVRTLIFAHGYAGNRLETGLPALALARSLVQAGYNVLMFDFRNSGQSEGKLTSVGQFEVNDLLGAVDWVAADHPGNIGVVGFSMGATTSILAAAQSPAIAAVVADSPFANLKQYLQDNLSVWSHLPNFPFTPMIMHILPPLTGIDASSVDANKAVDLVYPRPILFVHSGADPSIPVANSERLYSRHPDKFSLWKSGANTHVGSYKFAPQEYTSRVIDFFEKNL
jgi:fermentation-respiration switch protein FrsA (DUF1100 family)